jgi:hypothetical protein
MRPYRSAAKAAIDRPIDNNHRPIGPEGKSGDCMTSSRPAMAPPVLIRFVSSDLAWWMALACLCGVLLVPLLVVDVPPLLDYPNHLARIYVLASLPQDEVLARFYTPHWSIIPNLAVDLVGPPLIHILPVHVVGRLLIALALLLPVLGTVAYNVALGGRWWSFGVGLIAYNGCLFYGFLNFLISLGVALLLAAAWLRWREPHPVRAVALAVVGAPVLFACHLMGLLFFCLLIGFAELSAVWNSRSETGGLVRTAMTRGGVLALVVAAPTALYAASELQTLGGDAEWHGPLEKVRHFVSTFANYDWPLDITTTILIIGFPALCMIARMGRLPRVAGAVTGALALLFVASPSSWKGTYLLDTRFAVMLCFMLFAGFLPVNWPWRSRYLATGLLLLLFSIRMAVLTTTWANDRTDIADLRATLAPVQPGQAVYVAAGSYRDNPDWRGYIGSHLLSNNVRMDDHVGALALIERRAYWPFEFDVPSQQPIETNEPYRTLVSGMGYLPDRTDALTNNLCGFDYVLMTRANAVPELPADRFRLLVHSGYAALYAIADCHPRR